MFNYEIFCLTNFLKIFFNFSCSLTGNVFESKNFQNKIRIA